MKFATLTRCWLSKDHGLRSRCLTKEVIYNLLTDKEGEKKRCDFFFISNIICQRHAKLSRTNSINHQHFLWTEGFEMSIFWTWTSEPAVDRSQKNCCPPLNWIESFMFLGLKMTLAQTFISYFTLLGARFLNLLMKGSCWPNFRCLASIVYAREWWISQSVYIDYINKCHQSYIFCYNIH